MKQQVTFELVRDIFVRELGSEPSEITPTADLVDDLGLDSLDQIELVLAFEEVLEIHIDESGEAINKVRTVSDVVSYLNAVGRGEAA